MSLAISIIVLLLCMTMFVLPTTKKLELILFSSICLNCFTFSYVSFGTCNIMLCVFFFLSEFKNYKKYLHVLNNSKIKNPLIIVTIGTLILVMYSPNTRSIITSTGLIVTDLIAKYFVLAYVYVAFKSNKCLDKFFKIVTTAIIILTFFGVLNFITKSSIIADITGKQGTQFANMERSRIVAMFSYSFDYGFCCCVLSIFALYGKASKVISPIRFRIIFLCSLFGIIICGGRTPVVVEAIMLSIYFATAFKIHKSAAILLTLCGLTALSYATIPFVRSKIDTVATAFDSNNEEMSESSLYMRGIQFETVFKQIKGHEILGRGYRYFTMNLGYNKNGRGYRDLPESARGLLGLEGVAMNLLLERGFLGLTIYIIFYGGLIVVCYRRRKKTKFESAAAISIIVGFVSYGNMTGELSSAVISLFFIGLFIKLSDLRIRQQIAIHKHQKHNLSINHAEISCNSNTGI